MSNRHGLSRKPRVLLVTHELSRTGAPRVAAMVGRFLVSQGYDVHTISILAGPLAEDFAEFGPVSVEPCRSFRLKLWGIYRYRRLAKVLDLLLAWFYMLWLRPDIVYINSVVAAAYIRPALWRKCTVIVHSHESFDTMLWQIDYNYKALGYLDRMIFIACSPSVQADLVRLTRNPDIPLLNSVPDSAMVRRLAGDRAPRIPGRVVVGACGQVLARKGTDLWLRVAERVRERLPDRDVSFVWVGEVMDPAMAVPGPGVAFTGIASNPYRQIVDFDIMTLPSRDDPFPLVVLESMLLGIPVIAFDVGAVREQVGDTGVMVERENVEAFADAVITLVSDEALRTSLGAAARARAERDFSTEAFTRRLTELMAEW